MNKTTIYTAAVCATLYVSLACHSSQIFEPSESSEMDTGSTDESGDGDSDETWAGETGESGEGGLGYRFDLGDVPDAPPAVCGDGVLEPGEECELSESEPCDAGPGVRSCDADCLWDESWCWCTPGDPFCQCNGVGGCSWAWFECGEGGVCVPTAPACQAVMGEPCTQDMPCCNGVSCVHVSDEEWVCGNG